MTTREMPKNAKKDNWFVVEEIPQNTPFMMSVPAKFFMQEWPKLGLGGEVKRYFSLFDGDYSKMCYVRKEFEAQADFLSKKMLANPGWALRVLGRVRKESQKFFSTAKKFRNLNFPKLSNRQLLQAWRKPLAAHTLSHGIGGSVSWHADAEGERLTHAFFKVIEKQARKFKVKMPVPEIFSILSTPREESYVKKEEKDLLKLAVKIKHAKNLKKYERLLETHTQKYNWLNYQYKGPVYQIDYFRDRLEALIHGRKNEAQKLSHNIETADREVFQKQKILIKKLRFSALQTKLFRMSREIGKPAR